MLQNYYESEIVNMQIVKILNCKNCKKARYGLFFLFHDYLAVWATMMGNECFMIIINKTK